MDGKQKCDFLNAICLHMYMYACACSTAMHKYIFILFTYTHNYIYIVNDEGRILTLSNMIVCPGLQHVSAAGHARILNDFDTLGVPRKSIFPVFFQIKQPFCVAF